MPRHILLIAIAALFASGAQACVFGFDTSYDAQGADDDNSDIDSGDASDAAENDDSTSEDAHTEVADVGDDLDANDLDTTDADADLDDLDTTDASDTSDAETDTCVENGCGGCSELPTLGAPCGPCDLDEYVCDGTDAVACDGETACTGAPPLPPEGVRASDGESDTAVRVIWNAVPALTTGYRVYRDGDFVAEVDAALLYDDTAAPEPPVPAAVADLTASTDRTDGIALAWSAATTADGRTATYTVTASGPGGESSPSLANTGYRSARPVLGYEVRIGDGAWIELDSDTTALLGAASITVPRVQAGTISASSDDPARVNLAASGFATVDTAASAICVRARNSTGAGDPSDAAAGLWRAGALSIGWERGASAGGSFTALAGLTGASVSDASATEGTTYWYRAVGTAPGAPVTAYSAAVAGSIAPAAPTGVNATTTREADVLVTWAAVPSATSYEVSINDGGYVAVSGPGTAHTDSAAEAGAIGACTAAASDGTSASVVALTCTPTPEIAAGSDRTYRVRAVNAVGPGAPSSAATGRRSGGTLLLQWERSAGDSDAAYSSLAGATTATSSDTTVSAGAGRYYRVALTAGTGVAAVTSNADRGYRAAAPTLSTSTPTSLTATAATFGASLTSLGAQTLTHAGWCYRQGTSTTCAGTSGASPCAAGWTNLTATSLPSSTGAFSRATTAALVAESDYRVCAYAANVAGIAHGAAVNFRTEAAVTGVALGATCTSDAQCPASSWCSTVTGQRRCAPIALSATASPMRFVYIPGGTFSMGSTAASNEQPVHDVTLSAYFVAQTEVTQAQWQAVAGSNPSGFTACGANCPVENMDWYSTAAYANALSIREGLSACYTITPSTCADTTSDWAGGTTTCTGTTYVGRSCTGYRLLTEAEWERAARGGTTGTYFWGEATDATTVGTYAWYSSNSGSTTRPVATKSPNGYGLYDTSGNVWERVWDWYGSSYSGFALSPDPVGPGPATNRVFRGGHWGTSGGNLRSADRNFYTPGARDNVIGVRLSRSLGP